MNVGKDSALSDGDTGQDLVQLLVVADAQLDVAWNDAGLVVVPGGVAGQLQDLGGEVPDITMKSRISNRQHAIKGQP